MKKIFVLCLVVALCLGVCAGCAKPSNQTYTLENCTVYDVGKYDGEIAIADTTMDIWVWHSDLDKSVGDKCSLNMNDNGTPNYLYDDFIVSIDWE